ncbi:hypothetical protein DLM45_09690 [Hyphomicrobium methylovorum]|nr:hypothetical protein [Hyphomicrobium methylovorum]
MVMSRVGVQMRDVTQALKRDLGKSLDPVERRRARMIPMRARAILSSRPGAFSGAVRWTSSSDKARG